MTNPSVLLASKLEDSVRNEFYKRYGLIVYSTIVDELFFTKALYMFFYKGKPYVLEVVIGMRSNIEEHDMLFSSACMKIDEMYRSLIMSSK